MAANPNQVAWKVEKPPDPFRTEARIDGFTVWVNRYGGWNIFCRLDGIDIMATGGGGLFERGFEKGKVQAVAALERLKALGAVGK